MTYPGARGSTATQIKSALHFELADATLHQAFDEVDLQLASRGEDAEGTDGKPFQLSVVNAAWAQRDFHIESAYLDTLAVNYGAGVFLLDFASEPEAARGRINGWVSERTNEHIKDLLPQGSVDESTRLVLTNAAYFNAAWAQPFEADLTKDAPFHAPSGDVTTKMMNGYIRDASYVKGEGFEAALVAYSAAELGMLIVLPDAGTFAAFDAALDAAKLEEALGSLEPGFDVEINLPRFKVNSQTDLSLILKKLGMVDAFGAAADFSGITGDRALSVGAVLHQAFVEVNEQGTEAAAATAVEFEDSASINVAQMQVDRPFLFGIVDVPTGELLFLGRVLDPSK